MDLHEFFKTVKGIINTVVYCPLRIEIPNSLNEKCGKQIAKGGQNRCLHRGGGGEM